MMGVIRNVKQSFGMKEDIIDPSQSRKGVRLTYSDAAVNPKGKHPFNRQPMWRILQQPSPLRFSSALGTSSAFIIPGLRGKEVRHD